MPHIEHECNTVINNNTEADFNDRFEEPESDCIVQATPLDDQYMNFMQHNSKAEAEQNKFARAGGSRAGHLRYTGRHG